MVFDFENSKQFNGAVTTTEAIKAVQADYNVQRGGLVMITNEMMQNLKNGEHVNFTISMDDIITSHIATYRNDNEKVLGVVGSRYEIVQNAKAFEFLDVLANQSNGNVPMITQAGVFNNGQRMFVSAKMPNNIRINGDESEGIEDYILFTNTHDGTGGVTILFTPIRVICQNTLNLALSKATNKMIIKHMPTANKRIDDLLKIGHIMMEKHDRYKDAFIQKLEALKAANGIGIQEVNLFATAVTTNNDKEIMDEITAINGDFERSEKLSERVKTRIRSLVNSIDQGIGQENFRGTKLWLYNGLTTHLQNNTDYKNGERKMESILWGTSQKKHDLGVALLAA